MTSTIRTPPRGLFLALLLAFCLPTATMAASSDFAKLAEVQRLLELSLKRIDALTTRVQELETAQSRSTAVATATAAPAPTPEIAPQRLEAVESQVAQLAASSASRRTDDTGLPLHGFADVGVGTRNPINPDLKGYNVGNLDFYLTPQLGERTRALFELNFEVNREGQVGVDLERAQIGYQVGDHTTLWGGRFHTPYGYVNTAMHHGNWISTSLRRPMFLQFEDSGGILPAHTVGAWITGTSRTADGKLLFDAYIGNGQQNQAGVLDMRNAGNTHGNMILGGRLAYQGTSGTLDGLTVGLHGLSAKIDSDLPLVRTSRVDMYGGYVVYDTDRWEDIAELYIFNNEDLTGHTGTHGSTAGFVQLGYRAMWGVPYVRYERTSLDQSDPYFALQSSGGSYHRGALGLRLDLDTKSALKFEISNTQDTDRLNDQYNAAMVQYAIRF